MALFGSGGGIASAIGNAASGVWQAGGEWAVRAFGLKTGESALDDNPFRSDAPGAADLVRRRVYRVTFPWRTGLRDTSLVPLYRDLAKYSEVGVGFHEALARLEKSQKSPALRRILGEIREDLLRGSTLGAAFARHEYLFDALHVALLEVGESLGTVAENMRMLIEIVEEKQTLRRSIARKLVQPVLLLVLANYVLTIPVFMLRGVLAYLAIVVPTTLFFMVVLLAIFVILPVAGAAIGPGIRDRVLLELPAFGTIARTNALSRFARAFGAAIGAGVEIDRSLRMAARAAGNSVVQDAVIAAIPFVKEHGLADGLQRGGILTAELAAEVGHGEATGTVAPTFLQISKDARERAARGTAVLGGILSFGLLAVTAIYAVLKTFSTVLGGVSGGFGGGPFDPFNDPRLR